MSLPKLELGDVVELRHEDPLETADKGSNLRSDDSSTSESNGSSASNSGSTITGFSVTENVAALENALQLRAEGKNPFDVAWDNAMTVYQNDFLQRIWASMNSGVGSLRDKAMDTVIHEAVLGLEEYVESHASLDPQGLFPSDHGWVFHILETQVGEMFKRIDRQLRDEIKPSYREDDAEVKERLDGDLVRTRREATNIIKRIASLRKPMERFRIRLQITVPALKRSAKQPGVYYLPEELLCRGPCVQVVRPPRARQSQHSQLCSKPQEQSLTSTAPSSAGWFQDLAFALSQGEIFDLIVNAFCDPAGACEFAAWLSVSYLSGH